MFSSSRFILPLLIFLCLLCCFFKPLQKADRIYIHTRIWTGDQENPWAEAIAISGNKILFVGKTYQPFVSEKTVIIDLHQKLMVPGFIDNHTHFLAGGYSLANLNLHPATTIQSFIVLFKTFIITHDGNKSDTRWIENGNWDNELWGGELPRKEWIDSISFNHPVFIKRYDIHMGLANSLALKLAHITRNTPDPTGGQILKDKLTGEPTGILKDNAMSLVLDIIPTPDKKQLDHYLNLALKEASSHGLTGVNDMSSFGGWADLATYQRAHLSTKLPLRIYSFVPILSWKKLSEYIKVNGRGDQLLHWGGLKAFVDGSLGSTTAWLNKPYLDAPNTTGLQTTDTILLKQLVIKADSAGLQVASHAIGDKANDFILNIYKEVEEKTGNNRQRFRIEHAQHLTASAIPKFASLHVIASMQPYHLIDDGKWAGKRLDSMRLMTSYAFNSLIHAGATVTFGSDWTVAPLEPLKGIYAAVTRRTLDKKNPAGWYPAQKITVEQALICYTASNAYAGFQEKLVGKLKAGMLADMVVLSADLFKIRPDKIEETQVLRTICDGNEVFKVKD